MENFNENISLFLPILNTIQEKALDSKINFELDFQNKELYTLQELTRCASLINYINSNGKSLILNCKSRSRVNHVFETFISIEDPMSVFIKNFEQFFAMYIHSKYGKDNFRIYMKECEKSPVAYPISVFEDGMCIFMQYNTSELRNYIYSIMTMFFYYTGQNFYDMIKPNVNRVPRPNLLDEFGDIDDEKQQNSHVNDRPQKSRQEKLCFLNKRNYNVKRPYLETQMQHDGLVTNTINDNCILTTIPDKQYPEVLVNRNIQKPLIGHDLFNNSVNVVPTAGCNKLSNQNESYIFKLSQQLQLECDSNLNVLGGNTKDFSKKFIQTNFKTIWSDNNRRQLVTLSIIHSIMNVCIQKITYTLLDKNTNLSVNTEENKKNNINNRTFVCPYKNDNECMNYSEENVDDRHIENKSVLQNKKLTKLKRPTLEIVFTRELLKRQDTNIGNGSIKFKN